MEYNENVEVYIMQRFGELKFSYREKIVCIKELLPWYFLNKGWKNKKSYLSVERSSLLKQKHYSIHYHRRINTCSKTSIDPRAFMMKIYLLFADCQFLEVFFMIYKLNDYYLRR